MLSKTNSTMQYKRVLLALSCLSFLWLAAPSQADARWGHHRHHRFQPRMAISLTGGLTLYDGEYVDEYGTYTDTALSHGIIGVGAHLWIHPNLSLDLGIDSHLITDYDTGEEWGYISFKPGARVRFGLFYLRGALDFAFGDAKSPVLIGFLVGAGIRVPISRRLRFIAEVDYQFLAGNGFVMPVNAKAGVEFVF